MASERKNQSLTVAYVETVTSYIELYTIFKQLDIHDLDQDADIEKLRQAIIQHLKKGKTESFPRQQWDTTSSAMKADLFNRSSLQELYRKTVEYINALPSAFKDNLNEMFPNYKQYMVNYMEEFKSSQCVLLVAGEMGSGKSSLVNLLLGKPILPTSDIRCTASLVEVRYGELPRAEMYFRDDSSGISLTPIKIQSTDKLVSTAFMNELENHITLRDPETDESPYEKIQLYWPLDMLKNGVVIVDSPGVGDSKAFPQQLADYMERAFGFIYVIDCTASIHKYRLGQLLMKAMQVNGDFFDPDTALFVFNRWDMIPQDSQEKVKSSLADKLSMIIPGVNKSQLFPISVKNSSTSIEYGQMTPEHKQIIGGIRRFLPQTMRGKLRIYYRFLSALLKRSLYSLRISYVTTKNRLVEMQQEATKRDHRIKMLQKEAEERLNQMRREVQTATIEAAEHIVKHLISMHTRTQISTWRENECPSRDAKWQNVVKNANMSISDRVATCINQWERGVHVEEKIVKDVVEKFEERFELFSHEVKEVKGVFLSDEDKKSFLDYHQSIKNSGGPKKIPKSPLKVGTDYGFLSIGAAVVTLFTLDAKNSDVKKLFKDRFDKDPVRVMMDATEFCLSGLETPMVAAALSKYFDRFIKGIDRVGKLVPTILKADQNLLSRIHKDLDNQEEHMKIYPKLSRDCSKLQGELDLFYVRRLIVTDFTADQFHYTDKDTLGQGSFASVYKAVLKLPNESIVVALKEPKDKITINDVTDVLLEENMMREVDNANIVKYYGMYRKGSDDNMRLNMVLEFCPYTLKDKYIAEGKDAPANHGDNPARQIACIETMTKLLIQLCNGLCYMHTKHIVHRDLKPENVLLSENNQVKIADLGLAKKVRDIVTVAIGTPVYMAPEVLLLNDKYDTKADIYSFGMIAWELWYGTDLALYASRELQGGLKNSIERKWRPSLTDTSAPTPFWRDLIIACWDQEPTKRPQAKEIGPHLLRVLSDISKRRA